MDIAEFSLKIGVALLAGAIIGLERQFQRKNAGLRTHSLVAVGSAIFVLISTSLIDQQGGDPTRVIGQIITGIGFLGAGVIIHQGVSIQGLTTAATIWCSAAIGSLAAPGMYVETAVCTAVVVAVNLVFRWVDEIIARKHNGEQQQN